MVVENRGCVQASSHWRAGWSDRNRNITNGNAEGMPAWAGQLTKTQIQNVAAFVYCATNKGAAGC